MAAALPGHFNIENTDETLKVIQIGNYTLFSFHSIKNKQYVSSPEKKENF